MKSPEDPPASEANRAPLVAARAPVAAWVQQAVAKESHAFAALHRHFGPLVHAIVLCRVAPADADDLVQETFARGWQRLDELRAPARFGAWISTIARNLCAAHHRKQSARPALVLAKGLAEEAESNPDTATPDAKLDAKRALSALRSLDPAFAEPLALRLIEGMTGPEIAARMGMTHGSVRVNLHRGMKLLRAQLRVPSESSAHNPAGKSTRNSEGESA